MNMKVLACDGIHEDGLSLFRDAGWEVAVAPAPLKDPAALAAALEGVDALPLHASAQIVTGLAVIAIACGVAVPTISAVPPETCRYHR